MSSCFWWHWAGPAWQPSMVPVSIREPYWQPYNFNDEDHYNGQCDFFIMWKLMLCYFIRHMIMNIFFSKKSSTKFKEYQLRYLDSRDTISIASSLNTGERMFLYMHGYRLLFFNSCGVFSLLWRPNWTPMAWVRVIQAQFSESSWFW